MRTPTPRAALVLLALVAPCSATGGLGNFALGGSRPNILFLLADDWPYEMWPSVATDDRGQATNYSALVPRLTTRKTTRKTRRCFRRRSRPGKG